LVIPELQFARFVLASTTYVRPSGAVRLALNEPLLAICAALN